MAWNSHEQGQREADQTWREFAYKARKKKLEAQLLAAKNKKPKKLSKKQKRLLRASQPFVRPNYYDYIKSKAWKARRRSYLDRHHWECEICGEYAYQVHHKSYERLGREPDRDLQALCEGCHQNTHEGEKPGCYDPMTREFMSLVAGF